MAAHMNKNNPTSSRPLHLPTVSQASPEPIPTEASTGPFEKLEAGEGALITTRANHAEGAQTALGKLSDRSISSRRALGAKRLSGEHKPRVAAKQTKIRVDKRIVAGLTLAALVVMAVVGTLFWRAITSAENTLVETSLVDQVVVKPGQTLNYGGYDYAIESASSDSGKYALTRNTPGSSEPLVLMELSGTPVALALYKGAFLIPENLENSWDVMAYTVGDGSMPSRLVDTTGSDFVGTGVLVSAALENDRLVLVDDQSRTFTTPLD